MPDAVDVIRQVRSAVGDSIVLGAGTVLDAETARAAILAGAEYIVSPIVNLDVIRLCRRYASWPCLVHSHRRRWSAPGKPGLMWSRFSRPTWVVLPT